jgi:hypothetical protein
MSDAPRFPAGWYADPDNPSVHRWWDGARWTEARQPAYPPAPPTYPPAAPQQPVQQQQPAPQQQPAAPQQPAAAPYQPSVPANVPAYPAAAPAAAPAQTERRDIPTGTVWIWLVVLLPVLSLLLLLFLDWQGLIDDIVSMAASPTTSGDAAQTWAINWTFASLGLTAASYVLIGAQIVFAYLDWRALRQRGVDRPFHWAWIFLALVISNGVYVIGRGVVLRRRTGSGMAPVWVWIAITVLGWVVGIILAVVFFNEIFAALAREGLLTGTTAP